MDSPNRAERDLVVYVVYFFIAYSLVVHLLAGLFGYYLSPENIIDADSYRGFLRKFNWNLYPLFYTISLYALGFSWNPFLTVWEKLIATKVIAIKSKADEEEVSQALVRYVRSWRWLCVALAITASLLLNYFAFKEDVWKMYTAKSQEEQMKRACSRPDFFSKWIFIDEKTKNEKVCIHTVCEPYVAKKSQTLPEGVVAAFYNKSPENELICKTGGAKPVPDEQWNMALIVYAQQFFMVVLAGLFMFQIVLHPMIFLFFEKTGVAKSYDLHIELNAESKAHEFGLEHWNQALNNVYWFLSMCLLIPIVSRLSQPNPGVPDLGQNLIRIFVALLVLSPMIATIISRQAKLPSVWDKLNRKKNKNKDEAWKAYHEQRLWPLDKNWSSKFGIILAMALASFLLGAEILKVTGL